MNLHILKSIVEAVIFFGKQKLLLRGHRDSHNSLSSNKGNLWAILEVMSRDDPILRKHLKWERKMHNILQKQSKTKLLTLLPSISGGRTPER